MFLADPIPFIADWLRTLLTEWGLSIGLIQVIFFILSAGLLTVGGMLFTVGLIWLERKLGGRFQDRIGPNRVGPWGIFQPIADMLKIFTKEFITPDGTDKVMYNLAPILAVSSVLGVLAVVPFSSTVYGVNLDVGVLYLIAIGAIGELGIILAGLGSNNKYALLGGFRAVAQLITYEVPLVLTLLIPVMLSGSMALNDIARTQTTWYIFLAPVAALVFFIASVAENARAPFDLVEADSEIVAGFNIEYSGLKFGMFYVADFLHAFTSALVFATIFLGGWRGPGAETVPILGFIYLLIKTAVVYFIGLALRFTLPRFRIDQMLALNWKYLTPLALFSVLLTTIVDKSLPVGSGWLKLGVLLVANVLLFLLADLLLTRFLNHQRKQIPLAAGPRPVVVAPAKPAAEPGEVNS